MRKDYSKLIRDLVPKKLDNKGIKYGVHIADNEEYKRKLREKLIEEAEEILEADENELLEEMADLAEVFEAILKAYGIPEEALTKARQEKNESRGAFNEKLILDWTEEN